MRRLGAFKSSLLLMLGAVPGTGAIASARTVREGERAPAKHGRWTYSATFMEESSGAGKRYVGRRISAIVAEEPDRDVVITVFVFYLPIGDE